MPLAHVPDTASWIAGVLVLCILVVLPLALAVRATPGAAFAARRVA